MKEIVTLKLENEMDLILANKRTMKLAELCGLSLIIQTTMATAVSEIARCALSVGQNTTFKLGIITLQPNKKQIFAVVCGTTEECGNAEAIRFAKRLVADVHVSRNGPFYDIQLNQDLKFSELFTDEKIESFIEYFKAEPPLSPYDEIRKRNIQLLELSVELKESENQYRELTDTLPLMMFLINAEGEIIYINQWFKDYFGPSVTALSTFSWRDLVHPDDYVAISKNWNNIFRSGSTFRAQGRLKHKGTGTYLWHLISVVPLKNENNGVMQWTGFFVDINAQKLIEETLKDNVELRLTQKKLVDYQQILEERISELRG